MSTINEVLEVATIDEMLLLTSIEIGNADVIKVADESFFHYQDLGTDTADGGFVLDGQNYQFVRDAFWNEIDLRWFGAKLDGITDDSDAWDLCSNYIARVFAETNSNSLNKAQGCVIRLATGISRITRTISLPKHFGIKGNGIYSSIIYADMNSDNGTEDAISVPEVIVYKQCVFEDFSIEGAVASSSTTDEKRYKPRDLVHLVNGFVVMRNVSLERADRYCLKINTAINSYFEKIYASRSRISSLHIGPEEEGAISTSTQFNSCYFRSSHRGPAAHIRKCISTHFYSCVFEAAGDEDPTSANGLRLEGTLNSPVATALLGCHFEANKGQHVYASLSKIEIDSNTYFTGIPIDENIDASLTFDRCDVTLNNPNITVGLPKRFEIILNDTSSTALRGIVYLNLLRFTENEILLKQYDSVTETSTQISFEEASHARFFLNCINSTGAGNSFYNGLGGRGTIYTGGLHEVDISPSDRAIQTLYKKTAGASRYSSLDIYANDISGIKTLFARLKYQFLNLTSKTFAYIFETFSEGVASVKMSIWNYGVAIGGHVHARADLHAIGKSVLGIDGEVSDANMVENNSPQINLYLDEANNKLHLKVKYSGTDNPTFKDVVIDLTNAQVSVS